MPMRLELQLAGNLPRWVLRFELRSQQYMLETAEPSLQPKILRTLKKKNNKGGKSANKCPLIK